MHKGKILFDNGTETVIDCKKCGFAHVNPLPSQNELNDFYEKKFYQSVKKNYFSDFERDHDWWALNYNWIIDELIKLSGKKSNKSTSSLLDIGSGPGLFLDVARSRGLDALGIEPSTNAFKHSVKKYKCKVLNTTLEKVDSSVGKFDYISSYLVMEHILDPYHFLMKSKSLLAKNGLICIVVPNDFNPIQKIKIQLGGQPWWVNPKEHLNYFTGKSLKKLFEKAGLEVVYQRTSFPLDLFLLMGQDYTSNAALGPNCHNMRKTFEFNMNASGSVEFKEDLYKAFSKLGIGRELVIIGKKA